jgi:hypothetical protein
MGECNRLFANVRFVVFTSVTMKDALVIPVFVSYALVLFSTGLMFIFVFLPLVT